MNIKFLKFPYLQAILQPCRDYDIVYDYVYVLGTSINKSIFICMVSIQNKIHLPTQKWLYRGLINARIGTFRTPYLRMTLKQIAFCVHLFCN